MGVRRRNFATFVCALLAAVFLNGAKAWRYEQSIFPPEGSEYGAILSDIVAYSNGTVLFAASTRDGKAFVIRNGHSYHKWVQIEYDALLNDTDMHTDSIGLTEKVVFISVESDDNSRKEIKYAWIGENGKRQNQTEPMKMLYNESKMRKEIKYAWIGENGKRQNQTEPMKSLYEENETSVFKERFFAVSRDSIHVAMYITTIVQDSFHVGIVMYWTRDGNEYKYSGRYVFHNKIAKEEVSFMKFLNSYIILGAYNNETKKNIVYVVNDGDMRNFTVECPEGTVVGEASTYDPGSLLAVSCVCPYNESRSASPEENPCVATVFVYDITFEKTTHLATLNDTDYANPNLNYGKSICIFNDAIVVSSPYYREFVDKFGSETNTDCGAAENEELAHPFVYLYRNYKLEKRVYMNSEVAKNGFGATVSVMGDFLAVSAPYEGGQGRIYLFSVSQFSAETIGLILFGFLIVSILVILSVLTYYKLHPMSVSAIQPEFK